MYSRQFTYIYCVIDFCLCCAFIPFVLFSDFDREREWGACARSDERTRKTAAAAATTKFHLGNIATGEFAIVWKWAYPLILILRVFVAAAVLLHVQQKNTTNKSLLSDKIVNTASAIRVVVVASAVAADIMVLIVLKLLLLNLICRSSEKKMHSICSHTFFPSISICLSNTDSRAPVWAREP